MAFFGLLSAMPQARAEYQPGDLVTAIVDSPVTLSGRTVGAVAAGATVAVKQVDSGSLLVDGDAVGWIQKDAVVAFDKAEAHFTQQINRDPTRPLGYYSRAGVRQTRGDYELALADYGEAVRLDPGQCAYYVERGACYLETKQFERAAAEFTEAIRLCPGVANPYCGRGAAYCELGEYRQAIADWKSALDLDPQGIAPRACFVELLACCPDSELRNGAGAVQLATILCTETSWRDSQILHYLACAYAECADFHAAIKWEKKAIEHNPPGRTAHLANYEKALALFEEHKPLHEFLAFGR